MRNKRANIPDVSKMYTCSGSKFHIEYSPIVQRDGTIVLEPSGKMSIPEYINSFRDSTDIHFILQKIAQGDLSPLGHNPGMFGDFTEIPTDPAAILQYRINAERYFYRLPVDVRNKFDNSVTVFLREGQNQSKMFFESLGVKLDAPEAPGPIIKEEMEVSNS